MTTGSNITARDSNRNINSLITKVTGNLAKYRLHTGEALLAILRHAQTFDDCDKAKALVEAINPRDRTSLIGFFADVSPIRITKDGDTYKVKMVKGDRVFNMEKAASAEWFAFGKEQKTPEPKAIADLYETLLNSLKMNDNKLAKYDERQRNEVKRHAAALTTYISKVRAALNDEARGQAAGGTTEKAADEAAAGLVGMLTADAA